MAYDPKIKEQVRRGYIFERVSLEQAAQKANVAFNTARRWRTEAKASGDDWDMLHSQGFLANVFNILAKYKISVDVITTSEVSVALTLDKTGSASSGADMLSESLLNELRSYCSVQVETDLALVAIIGNNLHKQAGIAHQLFATLSDYNVRLISYGASTNNVCTLVKDSEADKVLCALHSALFE